MRKIICDGCGKVLVREMEVEDCKIYHQENLKRENVAVTLTLPSVEKRGALKGIIFKDMDLCFGCIGNIARSFGVGRGEER